MPPQGLKILCFKKGDLWVAQRFEYKGKNRWVQFPFDGSKIISTDEPHYWVQVQLPEGYSGYMKVGHHVSELMTVDELMKDYPEDHGEFVKMFFDYPLKNGGLPAQPLD